MKALLSSCTVNTRCHKKPPDAIVLVGPTGSGKSPLGEYAQAQGFGPRRCWHFDFGHQLRQAAAIGPPDNGLDGPATAIIRESLATGSLLEDRHFDIAKSLLHRFINHSVTNKSDLIILNGLPRHIDQAKRLSSCVNVIGVLYLYCPPDLVFKRIHNNSGGDRTERLDDTRALIETKLDIFEQRTKPLLNYYAARQIPVTTRHVSATSQPSDLWLP